MGKKKKATAQAFTHEPTDPDLSRTCCIPRGMLKPICKLYQHSEFLGMMSCPSPLILNTLDTIPVICSNHQCPLSGLMHKKCFTSLETLAIAQITKARIYRNKNYNQVCKFKHVYILHAYFIRLQ